MEQFEKYIKGLSNSKLKSKLKELEQNAEYLGKEIPKVDKDKRDMLQKEYNNDIAHIDQIKAEIKHREDKKKGKEPSTVEKLFPTVTTIIDNHKVPTDDDDDEPSENKEDDEMIDIDKINEEFEEISKEELKEKLKEELKAEIKNELKEEITNSKTPTKSTEEILSMETTVLIKDDLKKEKIEPKKEVNEETVKQKDILEEVIQQSNVEVNTPPKKNEKKANTKPIRPQTVLEEIKSDGSITKVVLGGSSMDMDMNIDDLLSIENDPNSQTMMLSTTKDTIINKAIPLITDEEVETYTDKRAERELELYIKFRDIVKEKMKEKGLDEELEKSLSSKLDIINKNINKLKIRTT